MFALIIKDLEVCLGNSNLLLEKSAVWFEPLAQKRKTGKQIADILYSQY